MSEGQPTPSQPAASPRWQPLGAIDRRVAGVLVEKAKTTPDNYPMSLNAICTACNQKSNRWPAMNLEPEDVEQSLERLRELGAVGMIEGYGRVQKYRHYLYEWLGVDKVELAVMAELLLRGAQTEGELRGRASRMEPIRDLGDLRPVVASLNSKGLMVSMTPEGRGHVVTHGLYPPAEFERLRAEYGQQGAGAGQAVEGALASPLSGPGASGPTEAAAAEISLLDGLQREVDALRTQLVQLRGEQEQLRAEVRETAEQLRRLRDALGS